MKVLFAILFLGMSSLNNTWSAGTPVPPTKPVATVSVPTVESEKLLYFASKYTYVRESKGYNRSPEIDAWNKYTNTAMASPYCASFVSYIHNLAGVKGPKSAWSPDCVAKNNIKFAEIKGGDVFGLYFSSKGRVAHTGFIESKNGNIVRTIEANTGADAQSGSAADRDGDGCHKKTRSSVLMGNSKNKFSRYWK